MIARVVIALVVAVVVTLGCLLLGTVLAMLKVDIATVVGDFIHTYAVAFGILAGLWFFFVGSRP